MRVNVKPCKIRDLVPGDLYSYDDQDEWDKRINNDPLCHSSGVEVFIRTNSFPLLKDDEHLDRDCFKIEIVKEAPNDES